MSRSSGTSCRALSCLAAVPDRGQRHARLPSLAHHARSDDKLLTRTLLLDESAARLLSPVAHQAKCVESVATPRALRFAID